MKYLSKRFISILLSFVFIAAAMVVYINFIKPTYATIKADQGKLAAEEQKNQEYKDIFNKLTNVHKSLQQAPDLQGRISMALPMQANAADSMNQITAIAMANGLRVVSVDITEAPIIPAVTVKPGAVSLVKSIGVLRNSVRVSGSYSELRAFLQGIESGVRISSLKSMRIDKMVAATNPDMFDAALEIETYYQVN